MKSLQQFYKNFVNRKPVTLWYKFEDDKFIFNHVEDGHNQLSKIFPNSRNKWNKKFGFQYDNIVTGCLFEYAWYLLFWKIIRWGKLRAKFKAIF